MAKQTVEPAEASPRAPDTIELFGIQIHPLDHDSAIKKILSWLESETRPCRMVVTPNVNHAVLYQENADFRAAYSAAALRLTDGRYLPLAARILARGELHTVNGSDLIPGVLSACRGRPGTRVFLLGAAPHVAESAASRIRNEFPWVNVAGTHSPAFGFETRRQETNEILKRVAAARPDLLIMGISPPRQEIWAAKHLSELETSALICGGATIDFLAGHKRRAPRWMQRIGMEWVHRTMTEPARLAPRYAQDGLRMLSLVYREWQRRSTEHQ